MNKSNRTALALAMTLAFAGTALAAGMSKPEYKAAQKNIAADYKAWKADCEPARGNARDICQAQAKGKERVALAELEANYKPGDKARYELRLAKASAIHSVAKEKCDDKAGNAKDVCVKEAEAAHLTAKADAKAQMKSANAIHTAGEKSAKANETADKKIAVAQKDAASDKRDADYAVAKEKCDTLAGVPKDTCVAEAKARFGKS